VVIVSPLIALMQDQVRAMRERNVSAVYAGIADD
jgi:superfamily II DNA helicase RecQ